MEEQLDNATPKSDFVFNDQGYVAVPTQALDPANAEPHAEVFFTIRAEEEGRIIVLNGKEYYLMTKEDLAEGIRGILADATSLFWTQDQEKV